MTIQSVGQSAPPFSLGGIDGKSYTLNQNGARLTLAVFFKVTCPTCALTFPYLEKLYQTYRGAGLAVWGISQDDKAASVEFAAKNGSTFPILLDNGFRVSRTYDPEFVPTGLLVDSESKIADNLLAFSKPQLNHISQTVAGRLRVPAAIIAPEDDGKPPFRPG